MAAQPLSSLADIAGNYDALFCDIWGVVHNGGRPYDDAVAALIAYRQTGGQVVLVSNSPRTNPAIERQLKRLGVDLEVCDAIMSSGQVTRDLIKAFEGQTIHHVGRFDDLGLFDGLNIKLGKVEDAACVVMSELWRLEDTPEDYLDSLVEWRERDLPLICVNPDKLVEEGDQLVYCPGAIADVYEEMGGQVIQAGKPYEPIYQAAYAALKPRADGGLVDPARILAIGDSVRTDATGAARGGFDLLFITGSLHAEELDAFGNPDPAAVSRLVAPSGAKLIGFQARLK